MNEQRHGYHHRVRNTLKAFVISLIFIGACSQALAQNDEIRRTQRAIFIFNFTRYFQWQNFDQLEEFKIGVLGDQPLYGTLTKMAPSRNVRSKPLRIVSFDQATGLGDVQLLYINKESKINLSKVISQIEGKNILLIGENYPFNQSMINIMDIGEEFRFEFNESKLEKNGFKMPSALRKLAVQSPTAWQDLYSKSTESLFQEREKVAQQQKKLDQLAMEIRKQQQAISKQQNSLNLQKELLDQQNDTIRYQNQLITDKLVELDSLEKDYENKVALLNDLEQEILEQTGILKKRDLQIDQQNENISKQDSLLVTRDDFISDQKSKINEQQTELAQTELQLSYQRNLTYLFIGLLLLAAVTVIFIYRNYRFKKKANIQLKNKNTEIAKQATELSVQNAKIQNFANIIKGREANLNSLLENTTDVIWSIRRNNELITCNSAFAEIFRELTGAMPKVGTTLNVASLPDQMRKRNGVLIQRVLSGKRFVVETQVMIQGEPRWYEMSFNPIYQDQEISGVSVFGRDVSARIAEVKNKSRFQEGLKFLNTLASQPEEDFDALISKGLKLACEYLGMSRGVICCMVEEEHPVHKVYSIAEGSQGDSLVNLDIAQMVFQEESVNIHSIKAHHQDRYLQERAAAQALLGRVIFRDYTKYGVVYFVDDRQSHSHFSSYDQEFVQRFANWLSTEVSRHDAAEKLKEAKEKAEVATQVKANFLSTITHEIRTPLNGIIGTAYLLLNKDPQKEQLKYLKILKNSGDNLLSLVNNVLDYNKIEQGKLELEYVDMDLEELTDSTVNAFAISANKKGVNLFLNYSKELKRYYGGDPTRISQVLNNLVNNAIKFTNDGNIELRVSLKRYGDEADRVLFEVIDSGIGIKEEEQRKIFEKFTQANKTVYREFGGSGLGLSISQSLLKLMDSSIEISSEPDEGSNFHFELKLPHGRPGLEREDESGLFGDSRNLGGISILLAEDNIHNQVIAEDFLNSWGAIVVTVENGEEALEKVQENTFDLILMDLHMPRKDGYEAAAAIRKLPDDYFQKVPILALSASANRNSKKRVLEAGMNDFISKPFHPKDFYYKIKEFAPGGDVALQQVEPVISEEPEIRRNEKYRKLFLKVMNESLGSLQEVIEAQNTPAVVEVTHKVKSSLRLMQFQEMGDRAEFFEEKLRSGTPIGELLGEIEVYFIDLKKLIEHFGATQVSRL